MVIETIGLSRRYRTDAGEVTALADVTLKIDHGEFVSIIGPSGSGKSTLLNLLGLLDSPDAGRYLLAGRDVSRVDRDAAALLRSSALGFVFQSFNLIARLTALENVEVPLLYGGPASRERATLAMAALERVGLDHRAFHRPQQLSGGEQQRVAIARALIREPLVILADEPTGAIDTETSQEIIGLFQHLNTDGCTVVLVTHDPAIAAKTDRIISMVDGRVIDDRRTNGATPPAVVTPPSFARTERRELFGYSYDCIRSAMRSLRVNPLRSMLTTLGIVVGVSAVVTTIAIGQGASSEIDAQMRSIGTDLLLVQPGAANDGIQRLGAGTARTLTETDAAAIEREIPAVLIAAPGISGTAPLVRGNRNWTALIGGVSPSYLRARDWQIALGRSFSAEEAASGNQVAVLGADTAERLFGRENALLQVIRVANVPFTVIGILAEKGQSSDTGRSQDDVVLLPLAAAKLRVLGHASALDRQAVDYILIKAADDVSPELVREQIGSILRARHAIAAEHEDDFIIGDPTAAIQTRASATRALTLLLAVVSGISLIVGGIGIMNIMLATVVERTREIGIRVAVGARQRDISIQFLVESLVLSLIGTAAGLVAGGAISSMIAVLFDWPVLFGAPVAGVAAVAGIAVGVFFGSYPATKAARLNPVDALRYD